MTCGTESASMAAERSTRRTTGKRVPRRNDSAASEPETTRQPTPEHRFVDIDPWAVLLEQLLKEPTDDDAGENRPAARAQPETGAAVKPKRPKKSEGRQ